MHRSILSWVTISCIVLLVSAVTAVPYEASESTNDLFDADALAKSLTVDVTPVTATDGTVTLGVTLGSTDARYQSLNGKSFAVSPKKTGGGIDVAVSSIDATITGLLSGKSAHILTTFSNGMAITDPGALDTADFDSMVQSEVSGIVADAPDPTTAVSKLQYGVAGPPTASYASCKKNIASVFSSSTYTSLWQTTKAKCKAGWKATKETVKDAWNDPKQFVKDHWVAILVVIIVIVVVAVIVLTLLYLFAAPPPATTPPSLRLTVQAFKEMGLFAHNMLGVAVDCDNPLVFYPRLGWPYPGYPIPVV